MSFRQKNISGKIKFIGSASFENKLGMHSKREGGLHTKGVRKQSYPDKPLVTVITAVFNAESTLERTITSITSQTYTNIEYIIIDGGSTDGTVSILTNYAEHIDYWVSEPDSGVYDAMNKGLALAQGDIINILNADDWHEPDFIEKHVKALKSCQADFSYGPLKIYSEDLHSVIGIAKPLSLGSINATVQEMPVPHITLCIKSNIYDKVGRFSLGFPIAADHDFMLRMIRYTQKGVEVPLVLSNAALGGISNSWKTNYEYMKVSIHHGKSWIAALCTFLVQVAKLAVSKLLPRPLLVFVLKLVRSRFVIQ